MKGEKYILVIAIDNYKGAGFEKLSNAKLDAKRLIKILTSKYGFQSNRKPLFDKAATRLAIIESLNELMSLTGDDTIIIYHAGHGIIHPMSEIGYWIPSDASQTVGDWITHAEIREYIKGCKAKHVLLIDDSCFSGAFHTKSRGVNGVASHYKKLSSDKSRLVLTSGRVEKVSDGREGKGSPFANALLNYLERNTEKQFSVSELATYVSRETGSKTNQQPKWGPIDNVGHEGGELVFEILENIKEGKNRTWDDNLNSFIEAKLNRSEWPYISKMNPETKSLGVWCQDQRSLKRKGKLSKEREEKLLNAGFVFDPYFEKFNKGFLKFLAFMIKTGLNDVPSHLQSQYKKEDAWHRLQQKRYAKAPCDPKSPKSYPQYRYDLFLKAGIPIEMTTREGWEQFQKKLVKFYETSERFITIPSQTDKNEDAANLGQALNDWMVKWKRNELSPERVAFLEQYVDKDFLFNKQKRSFEKQIKEYLKFRKEFPLENPSKELRKRPDVKKVIEWKAQVNHRLKNGNAPIQKWKVEQLNLISFPWSKGSRKRNQDQLKLHL